MSLSLITVHGTEFIYKYVNSSLVSGRYHFIVKFNEEI